MTLKLNGSSSGYTAIDAPAAAGSNTLTLPANNGSDGEFLKTNGSGVLSFAAAGGGKVVKHAFATQDTQVGPLTSSTWTDTGLSLSYSPVAANNIVYVLVSQQMYTTSAGSNGDGRSQYKLLNDSTTLQEIQFESSSSGSASELCGSGTFVAKFTAASTSAVTLKTQYRYVSGSGSTYAQLNGRASNMIVVELEP